MIVAFKISGPVIRALLALLILGALGACARPAGSGPNDPYEVQNRATHQGNIALDKALVRPSANAYGSVLPDPVRESVGNFSRNLSLPGFVVNNILQGDIKGAGQNGMRFLFNTVFGLGGILDPASDAGLFAAKTDFGETLYVWGVPEGNFVVLPVIGPSTERHMVGRVVDLFTNPLINSFPEPEKYYELAASTASRLGDRYRFSNTVDSIYYDSADSYAQARLLYLQNRRFQLGVSVAEKSDSVFEELYGN